MVDFKTIQVKELPRATESYNYKKEAKNILNKQLVFIMKFFSKDNNIYQYDELLDKIDDIYLEVKKITKDK